MKYIVSPRFWAFLAAGVWALVWLLGATAFVSQQNNYNAFWMLAIFSTPSSLIVNGLLHALGAVIAPAPGALSFVGLCGFLLFGSAQYGALGYVFGIGLRRVFARREDES